MSLISQIQNAIPASKRPLEAIFIDLDDTLFRIDLLRTAVARLALRKPLFLLRLFLSVFSRTGMKKHAIKKAVALATIQDLDFQSIPVRQELISWLLARKKEGSRVVLCSAASDAYIPALQASFPWIDSFLMSTSEINLAGGAKTKAIKEWARHDSIDPEAIFFIGNTKDDAPVAASFDSLLIPRKDISISLSLWSAMRPEQWSKNLLVFVPALFASGEALSAALQDSLLAFALLSLIASGTYLINDILDFHSDIRHGIKSQRSIPSGRLDALTALIASFLLIFGPLVVSYLALGQPATSVLVFYLFGNVLYSVKLKKVAIVDLFALAGLYVVRVILGSVIFASEPSVWFISFLFFSFLGLAAAKRTSEFNHAGAGDLESRNYSPKDSELVSEIAVGSIFGALITLSLYVELSAQAEVFRAGPALWLVVPAIGLVFFRLLRASRHGWMKSDPIRWILRDRVSIVVCVATLVFLALLRL